MFHAYIGASQTESGSLGSFDAGVALRTGERTNGVNCSNWGPSLGRLGAWQKFTYGSGWSYLVGGVQTDCWSVSGINGTGDFHVSN